jgi:hypothetical protein
MCPKKRGKIYLKSISSGCSHRKPSIVFQILAEIFGYHVDIIKYLISEVVALREL